MATLRAGTLWPLAAFINYAYVPVPLRVLFINLVGISWSTFLSLSVARATPRALKHKLKGST